MAERKKTTAKSTEEVKSENLTDVKNTAKDEKLKKAEEKISILEKMLQELQEKVKESPTNIIRIMNDTEKVVLRFQGDVADDNIHSFGPNAMYGQITGRTGILTVPKSEWSRFLDELTRRFIDMRWLIVLSGLTDEERKTYNCDYKDGEILDERAFNNMVEMGDEMLAVFPKLCTTHQEMVARAYYEAFNNGKISEKDRNLVLALNEYSKKSYINSPNKKLKKGAFWPVIEGLNQKEEANNL